MNEEYLFLLDSYCFIWKNDEQILLYNTLSEQGFIYENVAGLSDFIEQLVQKENLYCISVTPTDLSNQAITDFIYSARENFCGDLLKKGDSVGKPIVILPEANINEDVNRNLDEISSSAVFGSTIMKNLTDVYLELGGICKYNCRDCHNIHKQIEWCYSIETVMSIEKVKEIFESIKYANVFDIHLMGGNLLDYPSWEELIRLISGYADHFKFKVNFHINGKHFRDIAYKSKIKELTEVDNIYLNIHIEAADLSPALSESLQEIKEKAEFLVKITDEEELMSVSEILNNQEIDSKILPYFTGNNFPFFEKYVFQEKEDILHSPLSKKDILARQAVNTNHFGKLYVKVNGEVYSHPCGEPVGHYPERIQKAVHRELKNGTFWRKTRDQVEPCKACLYRYLCPSPSNYEEVTGKFDFCHLQELSK